MTSLTWDFGDEILRIEPMSGGLKWKEFVLQKSSLKGPEQLRKHPSSLLPFHVPHHLHLAAKISNSKSFPAASTRPFPGKNKTKQNKIPKW